MPAEALGLLQPHLKHVVLAGRDSLNAPEASFPFVHFIDEGVGSVVLGPDRASGFEIGMVGREGLIGASVVLGAERGAHHVFMQVAGSGWRIAPSRLVEAMERSPALRRALLRYVHAYMVQIASTADAARYQVDERLARWFLMAHDRIDGDQFTLTHEILAIKVGVRRPSISAAMQMLDGEHMIRAGRGLVTILDRDKLKRRANGSYGLAEAEYERLIGPGQSRPEPKVLSFTSS